MRLGTGARDRRLNGALLLSRLVAPVAAGVEITVGKDEE
jgi:hypothetical protein